MLKTMTALDALEAATDYGGFDLSVAHGLTGDDVREYFSETNFRQMFPGEDPTECGGYSLAACAEAVIEALGLGGAR
jgi:hypothetical protein